MKFINRKQELIFLEERYKSKQAELIIIYGRRRIGKTELIINFLKNKKGMYFLGRLESREDTIKRFNYLLIDYFKDTEIAKKNLVNWDEIFEYLAKKATKETVLVIDEFPFIVEKFPEIISVLQDKWDNFLKKTRLMIILSGSSVGMMEKYALEYKSPLYGRRTGQWKIIELSPKYLVGFFPNYSISDLILVYSCIDTIPGYLVKFNKNYDVWENIKTKILSKGEFLYEEVELLLREELRDPSNYMSILSSIAGGMVNFNEIYVKTKLDKSLLSKYLFILEKLGIVEKITSIARSYKSRLKAKGALYFIKDNFFSFYFRFVYLNKQQLERGEIDGVLSEIKDQISHYVGNKFKGFIEEILPFFDIIQFTDSGRWWHKDKEIDIVALNEKNKEILFAECKWKEQINAEKIIKELIEKAKFVDWNNEKRKEYFAIFAKSFSKKIKEFEGKMVYCFDLKDIAKVLKDGHNNFLFKAQ